MFLSADTDLESRNQQIAIYKRVGPESRMNILFSLIKDVQTIAQQGIKDRHPEYSESQIECAYLAMIHGQELFRAVWPTRELVDP